MHCRTFILLQVFLASVVRSQYLPITHIRIFSVQNGSSRSNQVPNQRPPKSMLITPRQGDMEVRLYRMLVCVGNGKVIIGE